jgi:hypothetical protein
MVEKFRGKQKSAFDGAQSGPSKTATCTEFNLLKPCGFYVYVHV